MTISTYIFSYNRGTALKNLIYSSKKTKWPGKLIVYDDCSDDPFTISVLADISRDGYQIVNSRKRHGYRLGGLYNNMSEVLRNSRDEYVMFIQDDMQFVREVSHDEIARILTLLNSRPSPFLFQSFFTRSWSITERLEYCSNENLYHVTPTYPYGGASDVCIFNRQRLIQDGWEAFSTEQESDEQACRMYGPMTVYPDPFVAFVPFPAMPRMNYLKRLVASRGVAKMPRYREMNAEEVMAFKGRNKTHPPIDTDWLKIEGGIGYKVMSALFGVRY